MTKNITMDIDEVLELDYLIEKISDNTIDVTNEPTNGASSINYTSINRGIFNPSETGTYQLDINGQTIEIDVVDIPDSVVSEFEVDEGNGSTLNNEFSGQPDATINGASWISVSDLVGGYGLSFDGANNDVQIDIQYGFTDLSSPFTFCATVNMTDLATDQIIWHTGLGKGNGAFSVGTPVNTSGKLGGEIRDADNNIATTKQTSAVDTNRLRFGVGFDPTAPSVTLAVDGSITSTTSTDDNLRASPGSNNNVIGQGFNGTYYATMDEFDNPIWYDSALTDSEFGDDYSAQPWS